MNKPNGRLIVLEGCDDVGKSTIATRVVDALADAGKSPTLLAFPGHKPGSVGKWVYDLHHDPERQSINQTCLQLLHVAAHIDCIESQIKPLIETGNDVILDRYWWSTCAYGVIGGVELDRLEMMIELEESVWGDCRPHCIVLLRRKAAERAANADLVSEYEKLFDRERRHERAVEVWNDSDVESAVSQILDAVYTN